MKFRISHAGECERMRRIRKVWNIISEEALNQTMTLKGPPDPLPGWGEIVAQAPGTQAALHPDDECAVKSSMEEEQMVDG